MCDSYVNSSLLHIELVDARHILAAHSLKYAEACGMCDSQLAVSAKVCSSGKRVDFICCYSQ